MKAKCCPRCLTLTENQEDDAIHTCSPTEAWRGMEAKIAELEVGIADLEAKIAALLSTEGSPFHDLVR
jgi:RNA polymerase subunit RPABC4/transcription elongation factor Spt4